MKKFAQLAFATFFFFVFVSSSNAAVTFYSSGEVTGNSVASRTNAQNLMNPWKATADSLGCQINPASIPVVTGVNIANLTSNGINFTAQTRNMSVGLTGVAGGNVDIQSGSTLQDNSPRPLSLYNTVSQPPYWNDTTGSSTNKNAVLFEFASPIRGFGAWFGDLETNNLGSLAYVRLLDNSGNQVGSDYIVNPDTSIAGVPASCGGTFNGCGNSTTRFIGFWSLPSDNVYKVLIVVGDDDIGGNGNTERLSFIGPMIPNNCGFKLGNQVWKDTDNNGIYNVGELPISGVEMNLYEDTDNSNTLTAGDLVPTDINGNSVSPIITPSSGQYLFSSLKAGNYIVAAKSSTLPMNYTASTNAVTDPDDDINNDNNGLVNNVSYTNFSSKVITLSSQSEPINDQDTIDQNGNAVTLPADNDANSNLTLDFGFFEKPKLTVTKVVNNGALGTKQVSDFTLTVTNSSNIATDVTSGVQNVFDLGTYTISETQDSDYTSVYSGDCDLNTHQVTLNPGEIKSCTITNTFNPAKLTVTKVVVNGLLGTKVVSDFNLTATNNSNLQVTNLTSGTQVDLISGSYTISETQDVNYTPVYSGDCDSSTHQVSLNPGEIKSCTITNTFNPAQIKLTKIVIDGNKIVDDFKFSLTNSSDSRAITNPTNISSGMISDVVAGTYTISETDDINYIATYSCLIGSQTINSNLIVLNPGEFADCTITNTFNPVKLTVTKIVNNGLLGTKQVSDFTLTATNTSNSIVTNLTSGTQIELISGTYTISENQDSNYTATYSGDCDSTTHQVTLNPGDTKSCTITNTSNLLAAPSLVVEKSSDSTEYSQSGKSISYTYVVKNTGNIKISNISLADDKIVSSNISCPKNYLEIAESMTCAGTYTTLTSDLVSTGLTNTVYATGNIIDGTQVKSNMASLKLNYKEVLANTGASFAFIPGIVMIMSSFMLMQILRRFKYL